MKYVKIPILLLFFAFTTTLSAEKIYILFDPNCMDQLEFKQSRLDGRGDYYVYQINIRSGEKLILEVGEEGNNVQNFLPSPTMSCSSGGFDQSLMKRINTNLDEIYMVYPKSDKKYVISPITTAAYYSKQGNTVSYDSPKYKFRFDTQNGTIGENIAIDNPNAKVYFEGRVDNGCTGAYLFRQLAPYSAYPLIDLVLVPEIGVVEEKSGANAAAADMNKITLNRMNGKASTKYLSEICGSEPGSVRSMLSNTMAQNVPTAYSASRGGPYTPSPAGLPAGAIILNQNNNPANTAVPNPTPQQPVFQPAPTQAVPTQPAVTQAPVTTPIQTTGPSTHTVQSGETLYGISRKYSVSVPNIKQWNNLKSNTIRRGQVLQIKDPNASGMASNVVNNNVPSPSPSMQTRGSSNTTIGGGLIPYDQQNTQRIDTNNDLHIVKPGETVASIALNYGYTAKRFREMNDLGPNDYVKVGQRLKTSDCNCPSANANAPANASYSKPSIPTPSQYNNSANAGRITPNNLSPRTPTSYSQPTNSNFGSKIENTGGLPAYSPKGGDTESSSLYNAVMPSAYETTANDVKSSLSNLENRATNTYNEAVPSSYNTPVSSYVPPTISPFPTPNTPINANKVNKSDTDNSQRRIHIVAEGESLYGIARRYGTTPEQLRQLNNLGPSDPIIAYQTLYLN